MNMFLLTRGMKWHRDRFVEQLANLWVPWHIKGEKGKKADKAVQVLLQPVEMWSLCFPEENLDKMLRTLEPWDQIAITSEECASPKRKLSLAMLRKGLGLKKLPKWDKKDGSRFPLYKDHMQIIGIGTKEDYRDENGNECL